MAKRSGKRGTRAPRHARGALSLSKGGAASSAEVGDSSRAGRIVEAAMALFEEHGYSATTVDEIASRARVAKGSVYWHFKSKEGLLLAIVDKSVGGVMDSVEKRLEAAGEEPESAIETVLDLEMWDTVGLERATRIVVGALADSGGWDEAARLQGKLIRRGQKIFSRAHSALADAFRRMKTPAGLDPDAAATILVCCLHGLTHLRQVMQDQGKRTKKLTRSLRVLFLGRDARGTPKGKSRGRAR